MTLQELLDQCAGAVLDDRSGQLSGAPDAIWNDDALVRYFNEAQRRLCREALVLTDDAASAATQLTLTANQAEYALDKSVLRVLSAQLSDSSIDLVASSYDELRPRATFLENDFFDTNVPYADQPGRPRWFATDTALRMLRLRPVPDATSAALKLNLRVVRMPLTYLSVTALQGVPEVPEEYHMALVDFAVWRALSQPDADEMYLPVANNYKEYWEEALAGAKRDRRKAQAAPGRFAWGSGGFSWVR